MAMDKTIRRITDVEQQDAENYRYWQSLPLGERLGAVWQTTRNAYAFRKADDAVSEPRSRRPFIRIECPWS
jgi:hypothetical protein